MVWVYEEWANERMGEFGKWESLMDGKERIVNRIIKRMGSGKNGGGEYLNTEESQFESRHR